MTDGFDDGVFPGLRAGQDLVYVLEKRRRQLVVIGPGDVMVVARPGWHYETEEDAIADVEALIDQQL